MRAQVRSGRDPLRYDYVWVCAHCLCAGCFNGDHQKCRWPGRPSLRSAHELANRDLELRHYWEGRLVDQYGNAPPKVEKPEPHTPDPFELHRSAPAGCCNAITQSEFNPATDMPIETECGEDALFTTTRGGEPFSICEVCAAEMYPAHLAAIAESALWFLNTERTLEVLHANW